MTDSAAQPCPTCEQPVRWGSWRQYPPAWTGAVSRGDVRDGACECSGKRYVETRLPQTLFVRMRRRESTTARAASSP